MDDKDKIKVSIRVRPFNKDPIDQSNKASPWIITNDSITHIKGTQPFSYDSIFGMSSTTLNLFNMVAKDIVDSALNGINGTIFTYGQTSSGKTHTMKGTDTHPGIIPLSIQHIFNHIQNTSNQHEYSTRVSYMEIYNEELKDLLVSGNNNNNKKTKLKIHEDGDRSIYVGGLREEQVTSVEQVTNILKSGEEKRHVGTTNMNESSSRSHTIFRLHIERHEKGDDSSNQTQSGIVPGQGRAPHSTSKRAKLISVLTLVDLAGSERASSTGAEGMRLKEGNHINKSLSTLCTVVSKLSEGKDGQHIPYRDSKLTRILQSSLGGNSKTAIICTITPSAHHVDESLSTLNFAKRAKNIKTNYRINQVQDNAALYQKVVKENQELKNKLKQQQARLDPSTASSTFGRGLGLGFLQSIFGSGASSNASSVLTNDTSAIVWDEDQMSSTPSVAQMPTKKRRETWAPESDQSRIKKLRVGAAPINQSNVNLDVSATTPSTSTSLATTPINPNKSTSSAVTNIQHQLKITNDEKLELAAQLEDERTNFQDTYQSMNEYIEMLEAEHARVQCLQEENTMLQEELQGCEQLIDDCDEQIVTLNQRNEQMNIDLERMHTEAVQLEEAARAERDCLSAQLLTLGENYALLEQDRGSLHSDNQLLKSRIESLSASLDQFTLMFDPIREQINVYLEQHNQLRAEVTYLSEQNELMDAQHTEVAAHNADLARNNEDLARENQELRATHNEQGSRESDLAARLIEANKHAEALQGQLTEHQGIIDGLRRVKSQYDQEMEHIGHQLKAQRNTIQVLEQQIADKNKPIEEQLALVHQMESRLNAAFANHESSVDALNREINQKDDRNRQLTGDIERLEQASRRQEQTLANEKFELAQQLQQLEQHHQASHETSRMQLEMQTADNLELKARLSQLETMYQGRLEESKLMLEAKRAEVAQLADQLADASSKSSTLAKLVDELTAQKSDVDARFKEVVAEKDAAQSKMGVEVALLKDQVAKLKKAKPGEIVANKAIEREKDLLRTDNEKQKEKIATLEAKVKQVTMEKSAIQSEKATAERELNILKKSKADVEKELDKIRTTKKTETDRTKEYTTAIKTLTKANETLTKSNESLTKASDRYRVQVTDLEDQHAKRAEQLEAVAEEVAKLKDEKSALDETIASLEMDKAQYEIKLNTHEAEITRLHQESDKAKAQYEAKINTHEAHINKLQQDSEMAMTEHRASLTALQSQVDNKSSELETMTRALEEAKDSASRVVKELAEKETEKDNLCTQLAEFNFQIEEIKAELALVTSQLDTQLKERAKLEEQMAALRTELEGATKEREGLKNQLENERQEHVLASAKALASSEGDVKTYQDKIKSLEQETIELKECLEEEIAELEEDCTKLRQENDAKQAELDRLNAAILEQTSRHTELTKVNTDVVMQLDDKTKMCDELEHRVTELMDTSGQAVAGLANAQQDNIALESQTQTLHEKLEGVQREREALAAQNSKLAATITEQDTKMDILEQSMEQLRNSLATEQANVSRMASQIESIEDERRQTVNEAEAKQAKQEDTIRRLNLAIEYARFEKDRDVEELKNQFAAYIKAERQRTDAGQTDLETLRKTLAAKEHELELKNKEMEDLEEEHYKKLENKINECKSLEKELAQHRLAKHQYEMQASLGASVNNGTRPNIDLPVSSSILKNNTGVINHHASPTKNTSLSASLATPSISQGLSHKQSYVPPLKPLLKPKATTTTKRASNANTQSTSTCK
ncbi:hypothetical protein SAMD00019534_114560 [Acytostelium subglobosum LB1]|uniref:hypothetical protein n=1 Tax=Acytostelium subglobosum LB1 TaxID=1410327 RepID=UPI000644AFF2|nr:hypothetical protein SAMD00019534_114560 [Acytostelium subglobosum LB1]GAM28280.1 hypothetical protein SAMD00019534_114560 [Acytostelium subglobosum LB1]|eukprot:XP_012748914.1 hypothetical protein SAMD00019534_114560 [Acytostelium subglobosum LB1]